MLWPMLESYETESGRCDSKDYERLEKLDNKNVDAIRDVVAAYRLIYADEMSRQQSVDGRLTTVLGMASLASSFIIALVAFVTSKRIEDFSVWSVVTICVVGLYTIFQFLRAVMASLEGLRGRAVEWVSPDDCCPEGAEEDGVFLIRQAKAYLKCINDHETNTSRKFDQLHLAHRAMKNAVFAMLLIAITLVGSILLTIT